MRPASIVGIVLIILGVLALVYRGIGYTDRDTHDLGPVDITTEEHKSIPVSPILGGVAIIAGVALVFAGSRRRAE